MLLGSLGGGRALVSWEMVRGCDGGGRGRKKMLVSWIDDVDEDRGFYSFADDGENPGWRSGTRVAGWGDFFFYCIGREAFRFSDNKVGNV